MKEFLIYFLFLFYYVRCDNEECEPYRYNSTKESNCVDDFVVHPCDNGTCHFEFENKYISCNVTEIQNINNYSINDYNSLFPYFNFNSLNEGENCSIDTDCPQDYGCLNGKCTAYFSKKDLENVSNTSLFNKIDGRRFCMSFNQVDGLCQTLYLIEYNQTRKKNEDCIYRNRYNQIINLKDVRSCGYDGYAHCPIGANSRYYTDYLTMMRIMYLNNPNCNNNERMTLCEKDLKSDDEVIKKQVKYYKETQFLFEKGQSFKSLLNKEVENSNDILNIIAPEYQKTEVSKICPTFKCIDNDDKKRVNCLETVYSSQSINVSLFDICKDKEYCSVGGSNPLMLMQGKAVNGVCKEIINSTISLRYPGENCMNAPCAYGECINNYCTGKKVDEKCDNDSQCFNGTYCSNNICKPQLKEGESCKTTYECQNNLLCYNHTCQDILFSLTGSIMQDETDTAPKEYYCKYGTADYSKNICYEIHSESGSNQGSKGFEYQNCTYGTQCTYHRSDDKTKKIYKQCECGFNSEGKAYCPLAHDQDKEIWEKYFKALARKFNNNCHTLSRYNCFTSNEYAVNDISFYSHYLEKGHLFYKAVKCAIKVLNAYYLQSTLMATITLIGIIIFG